MIRTLNRYLQQESFPRWKRILGSSTPWLSAFCGWASSYWLIRHPECLSAHSFLNASLTYSSIAFGFCVTGITMCLAISDKQFVRKLVEKQVKGASHNTYSDLIFIFTWTAAAHILLIGFSLFTLFVFKPDERLFSTNYHWAVTGLSGGVVSLLLYSLMQFLTTVLTLSTVAETYIDHLRKPETKAAEKKLPKK